jgi:hypothetical protein
VDLELERLKTLFSVLQTMSLLTLEGKEVEEGEAVVVAKTTMKIWVQELSRFERLGS